MNYQEIEVIITPKGEVEIKVKGVTGMGCLELTRALEEALGGEVIARELQPEAYEVTQEQSQQLWTKTS